MRLRLFVAASAMSCVCGTQALAAAADQVCWRADEVRAVRFENLQHALMIDTLKCRDTVPVTVDSYNVLLTKQNDVFLKHKYIVESHFVRTLGLAAGMKAASDFDTQRTNHLSAAGIDVKRCQVTGLYARLAGSASEDDLLMLAGMLADVDVPAECADAIKLTTVPTAPVAMVIPVWSRRAPVPDAPAPSVATAPAVLVVSQPPLPAPHVSETATSVVAASGSVPVSQRQAAAQTAALIAQVHLERLAAAAPSPVIAAAAPIPVDAQPLPAPAVLSSAGVPQDQQRAASLKALQAAALALSQAVEAMQQTDRP